MNHILQALSQDTAARITILGPGGIGKSTLALAALHHPNAITKFSDHRYFIACDSASSRSDLISLIATYFGLEGHKKPASATINYISSKSSPVLLVLDNFDTPWEPLAGRAEVEDFLSRLSGVSNLHLIVGRYALSESNDSYFSTDHDARR